MPQGGKEIQRLADEKSTRKSSRYRAALSVTNVHVTLLCFHFSESCSSLQRISTAQKRFAPR